jgi:hypothetical protein
MGFLAVSWAFLKAIPWPIYAAVVIVASVWFYGERQHKAGYAEATAKYEAQIAAERAKYEDELTTLRAKQQEVITKTVIQYRDRVKVVKEKGDAIIQQVTTLVPLGSPLLAGGVRVAHDAAASGVMPGDPAGVAAAAAPVETSALVATVAENYEGCLATREQLIALQQIVSDLAK